MKKKTYTREDLAELLVSKFDISQKKAMEFVNQIVLSMYNALQKNGRLKISSFGTFNVNHKNERSGRNPKTGEPAKISDRNVLKFVPSSLLKQEVNNKRHQK